MEHTSLMCSMKNAVVVKWWNQRIPDATLRTEGKWSSFLLLYMSYDVSFESQRDQLKSGAGSLFFPPLTARILKQVATSKPSLFIILLRGSPLPSCQTLLISFYLLTSPCLCVKRASSKPSVNLCSSLVNSISSSPTHTCKATGKDAQATLDIALRSCLF